VPQQKTDLLQITESDGEGDAPRVGGHNMGKGTPEIIHPNAKISKTREEGNGALGGATARRERNLSGNAA